MTSSTEVPIRLPSTRNDSHSGAPTGAEPSSHASSYGDPHREVGSFGQGTPGPPSERRRARPKQQQRRLLDSKYVRHGNLSPCAHGAYSRVARSPFTPGPPLIGLRRAARCVSV